MKRLFVGALLFGRAGARALHAPDASSLLPALPKPGELPHRRLLARDIAQPPIGFSGYQYVSDTSFTLYGQDGPNLDQIMQGNLGVCYFDAALAAVLKSNKKFLTDGVREDGKDDDGDTVFKMRFFYDAQPQWLDVDTEFPENNFGTRLGNQQPLDNSTQPAKNILWVALWEKGFATFAQSHPDIMGTHPGQGYALINGGTGLEALAALSGQPVAQVDARSTPSPADLLGQLAVVDKGYNVLFAFCPSTQLNTLEGWNEQSASATFADGTRAQRLQNGQIELVDTDGTRVIVVDDHMYTVMQVDRTERVRLRNPWGDNPGTNDAEIWVAAALLRNAGGYAVVGDPIPGTHHGLSGGAVAGIVMGALVAVAGSSAGVFLLWRFDKCCFAPRG